MSANVEDSIRASRNAEADAAAAAHYAACIAGQIPRLLGALDREPQSLSHGCFDRDYWAWKFRDFPITMLQTAVYPLSELWRVGFPGNNCHANAEVLDWIVAAVRYTCRRQHADGGFDSVAPFARDHGVSLAMAHALAGTLRNLGDAAPADVTATVRTTVRRACRFAGRTREDYAFISNHHALFALALLSAHDLLADGELLERAEETIDGILRHQSADGWYREYDGPDPGYETLGLTYLARCWARTRSSTLLESMRRSVDFLSYCVHPDGSIGGNYGSRATSLYYPGGLELLAASLPQAQAVADFLYERLAGETSPPGPAGVDAQNLAPLLSSYMLALQARASRAPAGHTADLPCRAHQGIRLFAGAGIVVAGTGHYYAVANMAAGGVCRVFDRTASKLVHENAGYFAAAGKRRWTSQLRDAQCGIDASGGRTIRSAVRFTEVKQELPTPFKFVVLRLLNLTAFRSLALGNWIRSVLVRRLITGRTPGPLRLDRRITFGDNEIEFHDTIRSTTAVRIDELRRVRRVTAIHMGSARYFEDADLHASTPSDLPEMARVLNHGVAEASFTVRLEPPSGSAVAPSAGLDPLPSTP